MVIVKINRPKIGLRIKNHLKKGVDNNPLILHDSFDNHGLWTTL